MAEAPPLVRLPTSVPVGGTISRELRNPYSTPHVALSEHFAVHWGDSGGVSQVEVDRLLEALEHSWTVQIDELGHPAPSTSQQFYFNVYVGDSGDGAPLGYGAGGYYSPDLEGYPMLVVAAATLNSPAYADHTAAHEFFHAVQGSLDRYPYWGQSAWFWEATAEWAAVHTEPTSSVLGSFVFAYALLPDHALNFFDYPDDVQLQNYYQYGAFLFPLDVDRAAGTFEVVRDAWLDQGSVDDPLVVIDQLLDDRGIDFEEALLDHFVYASMWDYDQGAQFSSSTAQAQLFYPGSSRVFAEHGPDGSGGPVAVDASEAPMRFGFAAIRLPSLADGLLTATVDGEAVGTAGTDARFGARVVVVDGSGYTAHPVPFDAAGLSGSLTVDPTGADEAWLVVGSVAEQGRVDRFDTERFPFVYEVTVAPPVPVDTATEPTADTGLPTEPTTPVDTGTAPTTPTSSSTAEQPEPEPSSADEAPKGCGCASGVGGPAGWLAPLVLVGLRRRSR
jgi:hypothetical protein